MATIRRGVIKSYRIDKWLGLNEAPDGDTKLKFGEAAICRNWRVTQSGSIKRRPGTHAVLDLEDYVRALWVGRVGDSEYFLAAADGALWKISELNGEWSKTSLGAITTTGDVSIFGFDGKAYILTGSEYKVYDGSALSDVAGYVPLVSVAVAPAGGGTTLENVNRLNGKRRCWFSPDGAATGFVLPEQGLSSIDRVTDRVTGADYTAGTDYTADTANGKVTFAQAPGEGVSSIEVEWTVTAAQRSQVTGMRYAELYNGTSDNRVFIYGDGSNKLLYSGVDYNGQPRADYFPDLYEIAVGAENAPVTGAMKHYSRLIVTKPAELYTISASSQTLADKTVVPIYYLTPANRSLGNEAAGQCQLVLNSVRTLCAGAVYEWKNNSSYTANLTVDERQAKRISDRVRHTLSTFRLSECRCWDDNTSQEYYVVSGSTALIHNYASDVWYAYYNFPAACFARHGGELYIGCTDGKLRHVSDDYIGDDDAPIYAYWESGNIDFGDYTHEKYTPEFWIAHTPAEQGEFSVSGKTNRHEKDAALGEGAAWLADVKELDFSALDFAHINFGNESYQKIVKVLHRRLRLRKFIYYKMIFQANETDSGATVHSLSMNVTFGGESR